MTLQVCLIGQDGFVLGSDTRGVRLGPGEITQQYSTSKIYFNEHECAAWCSSGHHMARSLCDKLEELLAIPALNGPRTWMQFHSDLRRAVEVVQLSSSPEEQQVGQGRILLVAGMEGEIKGYLYEVGWVQNQQKWEIYRSIPFRDRMISGATGNAAIFFPQRFHSITRQEPEMLRIAAHTLLMGHRIDPGPIDGLEIVAFHAGKLRKLSDDELDSLRSFSDQLDCRMAEQFDSAPNVTD